MARQQGFSLLEVLVAFLILSLALGVLLRLFSQSSRGYHSAHSRQLALNLAQSKLAEVTGDADIASGSDRGEFDNGYGWQSRIERYRLPDEFNSPDIELIPFEVTVTVSWGQGEAEQLSLTTLMLGRRP
ncbi:type II secretion system protein [Gallaecimonas sp. GXIMD4217]|uniref:type IV pilus modification PilV family protein n=1 Tax=Gallaecimonas sp. GXIMD4217 TaxID=3131927 RepID=UPI00311B3F5D